MNNYNDISAVVDNNVIMDLFELKSINILFEVFDEVIIPDIIYNEELLEEVKNALNDYPYVLSGIDSQIGMEMYGQLTNENDFRNLSTHDKFAISIAKQFSYYCNSNDGLVRKACDKYEVRYLGILGVLKIAYLKKVINDEEIRKLSVKLTSDETSCYMNKKIVYKFLDEL